MRGSDPRQLAPGARKPARPYEVPERAFKASLARQLTEGAWGLVLAVVLPGLLMLAGLIYFLARGGSNLPEALIKLAPMIFVAGAPLLGRLIKGLTPSIGGTAKCAWIALGADYIRLGMSFFRPRILFDQIVDVERGWVGADRTWHPADQTHTMSEPPSSAAPASPPEPQFATNSAPKPGTPPKPGAMASISMPPDRTAQRIRIRFVMRGSWDVVAVAYPRHIDPTGELTSQLDLAARHTRAKLGVRENTPDTELSERYALISIQYESFRAAAAATPGLDPPADGSILPPARSWDMPEIDAPPTALPSPARQSDAREYADHYDEEAYAMQDAAFRTAK